MSIRKRISLSVQELIDCDTSINKGCYGGDPTGAFTYMITEGVGAVDDYQYEGKVR